MRWALKRALRIFIIIIVCLALTGCGGDGGSIYSNYREVEHLRLILTLGLDRTGETTALTISSGRAAGSGQGALMSLRGESVAAYIIPSDESLTVRDLAHWCAHNDDLAGYKCPRYYRFVRELPYNATGKKQHVVLKQQARQDLASGLLLRP